MRANGITFWIPVTLALYIATTATGRSADTEVNQLLVSRDLRGTKVALLIIDLEDGSVLAEVDPDQRMIPASNMKLITTAAALRLLEKDFRFQTQLRLISSDDWQSHRRGLNLEPDPDQAPSLLIRGDGDPAFCDPAGLKQRLFSTSSDFADGLDRGIVPAGLRREFAEHEVALSEHATTSLNQRGLRWLITAPGETFVVVWEDPRLLAREAESGVDPPLHIYRQLGVDDLINNWIDTIKKTGIRKFDRIIVDDRVFDREYVHRSWPPDQLNRHYCAQVSGLNFHLNLLHIWPEPTEPGRTPRILISPEGAVVETSNRAVTGITDTFGVDRLSGTNHLIYSGKIAQRKYAPFRVTVHEPHMFFARWFQGRLAAAGVEIGDVRHADEVEVLPDGQLLHVEQTTLFETLRRCNSDSVNLYAESLLKRIGRHYTGAGGSWINGAAAVRAFLHERLGANAAVVTIDDGSGLSRENRVTPRIMVKLLKSMYQDEQLGRAYLLSMAIGGTRGSLKKRFKQSALRGHVYAKSGYINAVSNLSGYVLVPDENIEGRERALAFSLLFNNIQQPVPVSRIKDLQQEILEIVASGYGLESLESRGRSPESRVARRGARRPLVHMTSSNSELILGRTGSDGATTGDP